MAAGEGVVLIGEVIEGTESPVLSCMFTTQMPFLFTPEGPRLVIVKQS